MQSNLFNKPLVHIFLIALLGLLAYSNSFNVPFAFDDEGGIETNQRIKDVSNIPSMFVELKGFFGSRPLMHATNALNYYFGGLDTRGYHAVNLALHLLNGILLYFLVITTGRFMDCGENGTRLAAVFSSLLFVLHPIQTEGVLYIVSRSMLFSTCFFFSGMLLFARAVISGKREGIYMVGLFVVSLLGVASRENFVTFPVMLFLYDICFISRFRLREAVGHYKLYLPVILSLAYMAYLVFYNTYDPSGDYLGEEGISPGQYFLMQFNVHWTYLRLLVLPINQNLDYDYPIAKTLFEFPTILSFLGYAGLWAGGILFAKKRPEVSFGVLWFLITLFPISFLVMFMDLRLGDVIFEHRLYLPSVGPIVAVVASGAFVLGRINSRKLTMATIVCVSVLTVVLGVATYARNDVWKSRISLWEDVVMRSPEKWKGHYNLGNEYQVAGFTNKAIEQYHISIRLNPEYVNTYNNLGISYKLMGLTDKAMEQYRHAIKLNPFHAEAYNNMGNIYMGRRLYDKALEQFGIAVILKPDNPRMNYNMGIAYYYKGLLDKAIEHFKIALSSNPNNADAHNSLGAAYLKLGLTEEARQEFERALQIDPSLPEAREFFRRISPASTSRPNEVRYER